MKLNMNVLQISGNLFFLGKCHWSHSAVRRLYRMYTIFYQIILHMAISILGGRAGFNATDAEIPKILVMLSSLGLRTILGFYLEFIALFSEIFLFKTPYLKVNLIPKKSKRS